MSKVGNGGLDQLGPVRCGQLSFGLRLKNRFGENGGTHQTKSISSRVKQANGRRKIKPVVTLPKLNLPDLEAE